MFATCSVWSESPNPSRKMGPQAKVRYGHPRLALLLKLLSFTGRIAGSATPNMCQHATGEEQRLNSLLKALGVGS